MVFPTITGVEYPVVDGAAGALSTRTQVLADSQQHSNRPCAGRHADNMANRWRAPIARIGSPQQQQRLPEPDPARAYQLERSGFRSILSRRLPRSANP